MGAMATRMTDQQASSWAAVRERGRRRYILVNGVLCWGVITGVLWSGVMWFQSHERTLPAFALLLGIALVGFPLGGLVWGAWMWRCMERRFGAWQAERTA